MLVTARVNHILDAVYPELVFQGCSFLAQDFPDIPTMAK